MFKIYWILVLLGSLAIVVMAQQIIKFRLAKIDMSFLEFTKRLLKGGGYKNLSPPALEDMLIHKPQNLTLVDLRDKPEIKKFEIPNAVSSPFNDFLKQVVVDKRYSPHDPIALICDTGHMSRVAANILVEDEDFTHVYNLKGGTKNWEQWHARRSGRIGCSACSN